jgi:preprotein translocase subunit SecG
MNKLKWILLIVFWFHTIIMAQAVTAEEKNEVTKNKTNTKFKLLDYEVDETKKTTS